MKKMSELMEDGLHLTMRQERRDIPLGRRQVSSNDPDVWLEPPVARSTCPQIVHPGALSLVGARMPVGIKNPQQRAVLFTK